MQSVAGIKDVACVPSTCLCLVGDSSEVFDVKRMVFRLAHDACCGG